VTSVSKSLQSILPCSTWTVHVVGGELTQEDEGSHAQQRADLGRVAAQAVCTGTVDTPAHA
jgi:hypothetical protein